MKKIFIGIDFSKEKFDASLIQAEGLKECAPSVHEVFDNKTSGYRRLVKWVKAHAEDYMRMLRCMQQMLEQRARGTGQLRNVGTGTCFRDE